jgi:hypothetical protein
LHRGRRDLPPGPTFSAARRKGATPTRWRERAVLMELFPADEGLQDRQFLPAGERVGIREPRTKKDGGMHGVNLV